MILSGKKGCLSIAAFCIIFRRDDIANAELGGHWRHGYDGGLGLGLDPVGITLSPR